MAETRPPREPFPTLLTPEDAMLYAAGRLEEMVSNMELISIFSEVLLKPGDTPRDISEDSQRLDSEVRTMASGIVDKDIQAKAMKEGAALIRHLATETKLASARAASLGIKPPVGA